MAIINPIELASTQSSASVTSDSDQLDYDMSNRAQLPRGIENIRPHLETMDNVPLLVSLFTDCVPATTKEMLKIMQESVSRASYHFPLILLLQKQCAKVA